MKPLFGTVVIENKAAPAARSAPWRWRARSPTATPSCSAAPARMVLNPAIMPQIRPTIRSRTSCRSAIFASRRPRSWCTVGAGEDVKELIAYVKANPGKLSLRLGRRRHDEQSLRRAVQAADGAPTSCTFPTRAPAPGIADLVSGHIPMMIAERHRPAAGIPPRRQDPHPGGECAERR